MKFFKNYKKVAILVLVGFGLFMVASTFISYSNTDNALRNRYKQKIDERTAFYDKMWKTIAQKKDIAVKNDDSFKQNIQVIMDGRKDAEGIFMKWVQESNPNANFQEVSALYKDLSRSVEAERDGFFYQEKMIQSIVLEHNNLLTQFPSSLVLAILGRDALDYKPITSDRTEKVMETGKDNDVDLF